jgi:hypothetical protein
MWQFQYFEHIFSIVWARLIANNLFDAAESHPSIFDEVNLIANLESAVRVTHPDHAYVCRKILKKAPLTSTPYCGPRNTLTHLIDIHGNHAPDGGTCPTHHACPASSAGRLLRDLPPTRGAGSVRGTRRFLHFRSRIHEVLVQFDLTPVAILKYHLGFPEHDLHHRLPYYAPW